MWPGDVYTADGHCFDAEIAHPRHGRPFRPEITCIIDVATRRVVGWSIDLAESGLAVLDALHSAINTGGIPSLFYVDNGSGYHNALMSAPGVGMEARLGFTMTHSIAYNSQARGIIERSHQTIWVKAAKELPTYIGKTMDAQAKQVIHKLTRKEVKASGKSRVLMDFPSFVTFCEAKVAAYNAHPHRSLPKVWNEAAGKMRHMSPDDAWAAGVTEGAQLMMISPEESNELFRPQQEVKVIRCEIRLFTNQYYAKELEEFHGDVVRVGYDVRNADHVWVYDATGRFICRAGFEANKRLYFPQNFIDQAAQKRAKGRERKLNIKLDEVHAELEGHSPTTIFAAPVELESNRSPRLVFTGLEPAAPVVAAVTINEPAPVAAQVEIAPAKRPLFLVDSEHYEWLMERRDAWNVADARFLRRYLDETDGYAQLAERFTHLGMAWSEKEEAVLNRFLNEAALDERAA
jgi:putative transposase